MSGRTIIKSSSSDVARRLLKALGSSKSVKKFGSMLTELKNLVDSSDLHKAVALVRELYHIFEMHALIIPLIAQN